MADRYEKSFTRKSPASEPAQPAPQEDPLAELARIVSGNQSFDDLVGRPAAAPRPAARPIPTRSSPRDLSFDLESELLNDLQSSFDPASRAAPQRAEPPVQQPRSAQPTASREPAEPPRPRAEPRAASWTSPRDSMEDDPYAGTAYASSDPERDRGPAPDPLAASRVFGRSRAVPPPEEEAVAYEDEGYYDDGSEPPYDDGEYGEERFTEYDGYDGDPPRRSRGKLIIAAVALAVVLAGGLAALALKGQMPAGGGSTPKVIAADPNPTKVEPAAQPVDEDGQQNKLIYDRANPDAGTEEQQLVLPDDGAVDAAPATNESAASREISRIILPGAPGDGSVEGSDGGSAAPGDSAQDGDAVPRKVRTVVIRPDGTIVSSEARAKDGSTAADAPAAAPPAAASEAPAADGSTDVAAVPVEPPPPAAEQPAAPAPADDSPMSALGPTVGPEPLPIGAEDGAAAAAPPAAAPQKDPSQLQPPKAAPKAAARAAAPDAVAPAPAAGGFVVQVTAQRSEEQAANAFRGLQRSYPSILGNRAPNIVRVDLGAKGIYYRARVGPMATRDEAISLCGALKAAGGDCIVQKN